MGLTWIRPWTGAGSLAPSGSPLPSTPLKSQVEQPSCCPPAPRIFSATFSLGKVPVFASKNHISLNGAICFKCLLAWRLPCPMIGTIKAAVSPF